MPRKKIPLIAADPYHITARCLNREWFELPLPTVWSIMEDYLFLVSCGYSLRIHAFVLMSNHFHLIVTAPEGNLSAALNYFLRETSKEITRLSGRINQTYGARNYKTWLTSHHYYLNTYKYLYQNPLRAGQCERVEDYRYSTLNGICGFSKLIVPVQDELLIPSRFDSQIYNWLNQKANNDFAEEMRLALRNSEFSLTRDKKTGKTSQLESILL